MTRLQRTVVIQLEVAVGSACRAAALEGLEDVVLVTLGKSRPDAILALASEPDACPVLLRVRRVREITGAALADDGRATDRRAVRPHVGQAVATTTEPTRAVPLIIAAARGASERCLGRRLVRQLVAPEQSLIARAAEAAPAMRALGSATQEATGPSCRPGHGRFPLMKVEEEACIAA